MALAVLILATAAPTLSIEASDRSVRVRAEASPLANVLEELTSRFEVRLVFDGPRPTAPITATLEGEDLLAVLKQLLEPRRMRYATSRDGARLRTLVVVTASEVQSSRPTPRPTPEEPTPQPFAESVPEPVLPDKPSPPDEP